MRSITKRVRKCAVSTREAKAGRGRRALEKLPRLFASKIWCKSLLRLLHVATKVEMELDQCLTKSRLELQCRIAGPMPLVAPKHSRLTSGHPAAHKVLRRTYKTGSFAPLEQKEKRGGRWGSRRSCSLNLEQKR